MVEFFLVFISALLVICAILINHNPKPIFGIYRQRNNFYWIKVLLMYALLSVRKLKRQDKYKENRLFAEIDCPQKLSLHSKAIDAAYLNGANKNGDHLVAGTARRKDGLVDGFFYLKIHDSKYGLLESPKLPSTSLRQIDDEINEFTAEGLKLTPIEPMRKWRLTYEGKMKDAENRNLVRDVKIEGVWTSQVPYFNFDCDIDPLCMAKSMAYEKWSRTHFKNLRGNHQTHYEQFGNLQVKATIDAEEFNLELDTLRDHSFGFRREWRQFKRYAEHFFTSANGDHFNVGLICLPIGFSRLTVGYVYSARKQKIYSVKECDFQLYQHGTNGRPPQNYAFSFRAGEEQYTVEVLMKDCPHFYISKDWEVKIYEGLCKYRVNGVEAWGAAEWQYRNISGKRVPDFAEEN